MKPLAVSWKWWAFPIISLAVLAGLNLVVAHLPANAALSEDHRNDTVDWAVYHRWGAMPRTIVIDIRGIRNASMADVDRGLFQIAERFANREYDRVILAYRGEARFQLEGSYFRRLGEEYSWQNPLVLIREMPENTYTLDGYPAFETWSGGWLGVMNAQMGDHRELHERWYLSETTRL